eukprot:GAHX01000732.1.p1 GENE.GAHX01000732.1~~GAHX01000732.1.p1  ORF type:complete len:438 (-),score=96.32 GAHX01000732.1:162-1475(-)
MKIIQITTNNILDTVSNISLQVSKQNCTNSFVYQKILTSSTINKGCRFLYNKPLHSTFILNISLLRNNPLILKTFEILNKGLFQSYTFYIIYTNRQTNIDGDALEILKYPLQTVTTPSYKEIQEIVRTKHTNITKDKLDFITNKLTGLKQQSIVRLLNSFPHLNGLNLNKFNNCLSLFPVSETKRASLLLPNITRKEMAGYNSVINKILSSIKSNSNLCKGVLLEGPPGTGKTMLTQRISFELNRKLIYQKSSQLLSCYLGESEERLRALFKEAKDLSPSILFFDEIDSLLSNRFDGTEVNNFDKRLLATFLTEIDALRDEEDVLIFAATNRVECLDMAFLRKGRIDLQFHIGVFEGEAGMKDIKEIFDLHFKGLVLKNQGKEIGKFLEKFIGKTASDIAAFCSKVKMYKLEKHLMNKKNIKEMKEVQLDELLKLVS